MGEGLWGALNGLIASSTVLVLLLRSYGASTVMIGAISAVEIVMTLAPQVLGAALFSSATGRQRRLIGWHFAAILPFVAAIGVITLLARRWHPAAARWAVFLCHGCFMFGIGVILAVWFDWLSGVFPQATRGRTLGIGFGASAVVNCAGGLAAGRLLSLSGRLPSFSILYLAAAVFGSASILTFSLIDDPNRHRTDPGRSLTPAGMAGWFRLSLADRNFRRFLLGRMLAAAGFCIVPFLAVHYTSSEGGSLTAAQLVTLGVFMPAGAALANVSFGWIGDRRGHRVGIAAEAALQALAIAILLLVPGPVGCAAVYFVSGLCGGAGAVAHLNMIFETCPHRQRLSHITIANLVLSLRAVFPLLAGLLVARLGLAAVLRGSLAVSAAAVAWCLAMVREPREAAAG